MDKRVLKPLEDLYFHHTNKNIESSQTIPYFTNDVFIVKRFFINKEEYKVGYIDNETGVENKQLAFRLTGLRLCPQLRSSLGDRFTREVITGDITKLINNHVIHPFLLFIRNRFVKWSDISMYRDSRYTFLVVENSADDTLTEKDIKILQLPIDNIVYSEKNLQDEDKTLIFGFNDEGELDVSGFTRFYMDQKLSNIGYIQLRLPKTTILEDDVSVPDECRLYASNFIIFRDNELHYDADIKISLYNTLTIDDGDTTYLEYKMFYDKRVLTPYNNVSQVINHQYLKNTYLNVKPNPAWLNILHEEFDFDFNKDKPYDENIEDFFKYTKAYNYRSFIDAIKSKSVTCITGYIDDIPENEKSRHLFMFPKEYTNNNLGYMIFINGILCNSRIVIDTSYGVYINLSRYSENSIYEFIVYDNKIYDKTCTTIESSFEGEYFTGYYSGGDFDLYSSDHPDRIFDLRQVFDLSQDETVLYQIDTSKYTCTETGIKFDDFYSNINQLIVHKVPKTRFAYEKFIIAKNEDFNVHLTNEMFKFCTDGNKYMVFVNGYRIHSSLYRIITPSPTLPFTDEAVYFSIVLKKGDIVEVFYTNMSTLDEVCIEDLNHSSETGSGVDQMGYITAPKELGLPVSRDLQFFFVNGIKIPYDYLMDISYDKVRIIVNMRTIENLCIVGFDSELTAFFKSLKLERSNLDLVYDAHDKSGINILTDTYTTVTNIKPQREKEIDDHALINEIVRYYYGPVNAGIPFRYDYDKSVYAEVDKDGNIVIDVMDASKRTNLNIDNKGE